MHIFKQIISELLCYQTDIAVQKLYFNFASESHIDKKPAYFNSSPYSPPQTFLCVLIIA